MFMHHQTAYLSVLVRSLHLHDGVSCVVGLEDGASVQEVGEEHGSKFVTTDVHREDRVCGARDVSGVRGSHTKLEELKGRSD